MRILVTGSSGFVGNVFVDKALKNSIELNLAVRSFVDKYEKKANQFLIDGLSKEQNWQRSLLECNVVVHIAARAHIMNDNAEDPLEEFRKTNVEGTLNLAQKAADSGVKRFIFISSIKVNGESTELGKPFEPDGNYIPSDPYGLSKYEAEIGLRKIALETGMEVVIIRPPLVYGPGVKANFADMMKWVNKGIPLPLGGIKQNKRSLVSVDNLVDLIITCIDHPNAANETFLVSDDDDVSTTQLLFNMAIALDSPNRLIPIPSKWFTVVAELIGKPAISQRLCGSLQVDISKTKALLGWKPPYSSTESMQKTANAFIDNLNTKK